MMQFAAVPEGADLGTPTDWHLQHLGSRAVAGAALVMTEATAIDPDGRSSVYDLGLWNDRQAESFQRITRFISGQGAVPGIQLVHAGRKGSTGRPWPDDERPQGGWVTVGPSQLPFGGYPAPAEMSTADIAETVESFAAAAHRAAAAGFKVLELHGAHGYLIHQFLSPHSNARQDRYGGPLENRMRFAVEVAEAVRTAWPTELPLFFRVSATDWLAGDTDDVRPGWTVPDTVRAGGPAQAPRRRPHRRVFGRLRARRQDSRRAQLPSSVLCPDTQGGRDPHRSSRTHHRGRTGRHHHRRW